jgi:hypothetical protein
MKDGLQVRYGTVGTIGTLKEGYRTSTEHKYAEYGN